MEYGRGNCRLLGMNRSRCHPLRPLRTAALTLLAALLAALLALGLATAAARAGTVMQTDSTIGETTFVVPAGVSSLQIEAVGGTGGEAGGDLAIGGPGAAVAGTLAVSAGETLYLEVGVGDGGGGIAGADGQTISAGGGDLFGWTYDTPSPVAEEVSDADSYGFIELIATDDGTGIRGGIGGGAGYDSHAVVYVGVPDVEAALQLAERLGGTRVTGPATSPTGLVVGHFKDPEGTLMGVAGAR